LRQLQKDVSQLTPLNRDLKRDEKARQESLRLYDEFKAGYEKALEQHSIGCVEDTFGNINVEIPVEKIDSLKAALQNLCEETLSEFLHLLVPLDTAEYYKGVENRLFDIKKRLQNRPLTIDALPTIAFDIATKGANPAVLEEFQSLYKRGVAEAIEATIKDMGSFNETIELRNAMLTSLINLGTIQSQETC
jgi:hypothetical protein